MPILETDYQTAESIKYMNNLFFATKVSFLNEMYLLVKKLMETGKKQLKVSFLMAELVTPI